MTSVRTLGPVHVVQGSFRTQVLRPGDAITIEQGDQKRTLSATRVTQADGTVLVIPDQPTLHIIRPHGTENPLFRPGPTSPEPNRLPGRPTLPICRPIGNPPTTLPRGGGISTLRGPLQPGLKLADKNKLNVTFKWIPTRIEEVNTVMIRLNFKMTLLGPTLIGGIHDGKELSRIDSLLSSPLSRRERRELGLALFQPQGPITTTVVDVPPPFQPRGALDSVIDALGKASGADRVVNAVGGWTQEVARFLASVLSELIPALAKIFILLASVVEIFLLGLSGVLAWITRNLWWLWWVLVSFAVLLGLRVFASVLVGAVDSAIEAWQRIMMTWQAFRRLLGLNE